MESQELRCKSCGNADLGLIRAGINWRRLPSFILIKAGVSLIASGIMLICGLFMLNGAYTVLQGIAAILGISTLIAYVVVQLWLTIKMLKKLFENNGAVYLICKSCGARKKIVDNVDEE